MKVLLISANTERINVTPLPLGLACVAAATRRAGHDVRLLDLMTQEDPQSRIREAIETSSPGVIGISVRNIDDQIRRGGRFLLEEVRRVVRCCRDFSRAPLVLGGAGYSIFPESVLAYLGADMGIRGEGETAFPALIDRLARHADPSDVPGLHLPGRGRRVEMTCTRNLDSLPLSGALEFLTSRDEELWLPFQTRRGCPMGCSYCSTAAIEGRRIRKRSPASAVDELARCAVAGFRQVYFVDNTFNLPRGYAKALCHAILGRGLKIRWRAILYPGGIDEELAALMAEAGCAEASLGFESGSERMLRSLNKRFSPEQVRRTSGLLARHRIRQMGFLLLGGPGETRDTVIESLRFADSLPLAQLKITSGIRIYPETLLAKTAVAEGVIAPEDDLLRPRFYIARGLEEWLSELVGKWMQERPTWMG